MNEKKLIQTMLKRKKTVGERLRLLRADIGWTQKFAAEMMNIPERRYQGLEYGENCRDERKKVVADAFGVDVMDIWR